jgi:tRNA threonylcarbamoyladenosine biosynthesis protein TsaB
MLLLAVDTATRAGSLAVLRDGQLAGEISTASEETYSSRLFRQCSFLLQELHLEIQNFDFFAVNAGPGSFTGLRVGLAAVKAWAEVFSKPIIAVSGLEAVASQAGNPSEDGLIAAVLDAHRGQIYAALYRFQDSRLAAVDADQVCAAEEFLARVAGRAKTAPVRFVSPSPEILRSLLNNSAAKRELPWSIHKASPVLAPVIAQLAHERASRGEVTDSLRLDANYVRRSDAELLWKEP